MHGSIKAGCIVLVNYKKSNIVGVVVDIILKDNKLVSANVDIGWLNTAVNRIVIIKAVDIVYNYGLNQNEIIEPLFFFLLDYYLLARQQTVEIRLNTFFMKYCHYNDCTVTKNIKKSLCEVHLGLIPYRFKSLLTDHCTMGNHSDICRLINNYLYILRDKDAIIEKGGESLLNDKLKEVTDQLDIHLVAQEEDYENGRIV